MTGNILSPMLVIGFVDFIFLVFLIIISTTIFATPSGVELKFPREVQSIQSNVVAQIDITSENVIYLDGKVVTLSELRRALAHPRFRNSQINLKANRDASMGRVSDIFDLCRGIPGVRVNVSSSL